MQSCRHYLEFFWSAECFKLDNKYILLVEASQEGWHPGQEAASHTCKALRSKKVAPTPASKPAATFEAVGRLTRLLITCPVSGSLMIASAHCQIQ